MKGKISPSMMCADWMHLKNTLEIMEQAGIEYLHIDVMDGVFVPNYTLGPDYCKAMKANCAIPLDLHLMVERPEEKLEYFPIGEGDIVAVHAESTHHLQRVLARIRSLGAKAFVALNPATPLCALEYVLPDLDGVLVMTVNPGFAGQKLIPQTLEKITQVRKFLDGQGYSQVEIEVDGNVSFENAVKMKAAGADIFVAGTSSVFAKDLTLAEGIARLREILD